MDYAETLKVVNKAIDGLIDDDLDTKGEAEAFKAIAKGLSTLLIDIAESLDALACADDS